MGGCPRFALTYGKKREETEPKTPFRRRGGELFIK
jgi:hypothetical protein